MVTMGSDNPQHPWGLSAAIKPTGNGSRSIDVEGRHVAASDLLLASRLGDGNIVTDLPLSATLHGEIGPDGVAAKPVRTDRRRCRVRQRRA